MEEGKRGRERRSDIGEKRGEWETGREVKKRARFTGSVAGVRSRAR